MTNLEKKFKMNNLKIENIRDRLYITSPKDIWFVYKFERKLILFHKSEHKNERKNKIRKTEMFFHRQMVCYNYDDIIKIIVDNDKFKGNESRMNNLFNMVKENEVPKYKFS